MSERFQAIIARSNTVSSDVREIWFDFDAMHRPRFEPGGHLDFEIPVAGAITTRSYSMVASDPEGRISIAVKLAAESRGGSYYMWSLSKGDRITGYSARNNLPVTYAGADYLLLAGGIGITPMIGIAKSLQQTGKAVRLVYCVRDATDAPFLEVLRRDLGTSLTVHEDRKSGIFDVQSLVSSLEKDTFLYMCGPTPMMDAVNRSWRDCDLPVDHLRFETFGTAGRFTTVAFMVEVVETGAVVQVAPNQSMLDALLAADQPTMFDCKKGECGLCKVTVVEIDGELDHRDVFLSEDQKVRAQDICCCVSRVYGSHIRIQIDAIMHGRRGAGHPKP